MTQRISLGLAAIALLGFVSAPCQATLAVLFAGVETTTGELSSTFADIMGPNGSDARFDYGASGTQQVWQTTPSLGLLESYDVVLFWTNFAPAPEWGDVLADYVDAGGRVVLATFTGVTTANSGDWSGSGINTSGYNPLIAPTDDSNGSRTFVAGPDPVHPIMQGVSSLSSSQFNGDYLPGLDTDAVLVASWNDGRPLVAVNADETVATVTLFPSNSTYPHVTGDYRLLFRNTLAYVGTSVAAIPEASAALVWGALSVAASVLSCRRQRC